jgi:hypothetical protein
MLVALIGFFAVAAAVRHLRQPRQHPRDERGAARGRRRATLVMLVGGFDLSISGFSLSGVILAKLLYAACRQASRSRS